MIAALVTIIGAVVVLILWWLVFDCDEDWFDEEQDDGDKMVEYCGGSDDAG